MFDLSLINNYLGESSGGNHGTAYFLDATGAFSKPIGSLLKEAVGGVSLPPETAWRLMRKGMVAATETRGQFRSRCPLYTDFFRIEPS